MRLVLVVSPYSGEVERNTAYARAALADSLSRGEAPLAFHLLYTQPGVLDDAVPRERWQGIYAGLLWIDVADAVAVYRDLGVSAGMEAEIDYAVRLGKPLVHRSLREWAGVPVGG